MPLVDLPLDELKTYTGSSPRPHDIDSFWDRSLSELDSIDPDWELSAAPFSTPEALCQDLYFTSHRGARIHAKYLRPLGEGPFPVLFMFHGYTGDSGDWFEKLAYVNAGFAVAALDCRGQGGLSQDSFPVAGNTHHGHIIRGAVEGPEHLLFRSIFLDTVQLVNTVCSFEEIDSSACAAYGGSQGGALTLACAALSPKIRRAASLYPFLCDYKRVWDLDLAKRAYGEITEYFRNFDPLHEREEQFFQTLGYIDVANISHRIEAEVLMGTGLSDEICPPSTQFAAYNDIASKKQVLIYPDFGHERLPGFNDRAYEFITGAWHPAT